MGHAHGIFDVDHERNPCPRCRVESARVLNGFENGSSEVLFDEDRRAYGVRHVADRHGRQVPEVDRFRWAAVGELAAYCTPRMAAVLTGLLTRSG